MTESYPEFFLRVTGNRLLPYQKRYGQNPFSPTLLIVPTGLGKTDSVVMPWLYARAVGDGSAPTRLILVLPRQNLTAQTARNAREGAKATGLDVRVIELMAGSGDNDEKLGPDDPVIIVSTQDMYFSRALNRGYARRPPRWPIDFALYNQDCLVVLDEIQLMDDALATSTQLAAFRERFGVFGGATCVWMSATVNPAWLDTVDSTGLPPQIRLNNDDLADPVVRKRFQAAKSLALAPESCRTPAGCAAFSLAQHREQTRTLILANTVPRAREIYAAIHSEFGNAILLHSRFRPADRKRGAGALLGSIPPEGQIVVATQVLEAGIDITARLLVTDLAPWGSLVQRFGRVNRYGDDAEAEIWWVDEPTYAKQKDKAAPYSPEELQHAMKCLEGLTSAAPSDLPEEDGPEPYQHVLRRADLLDLFDTTPDLSGNELDVSRFIRATEDKDVYLAWRDWEGEGVPPRRPELADDEICPVPIGEFREFARKHQVFTLSFATEEWDRIDRDSPIYPGMLCVARSKEGGYTALDGWSPDSKAPVSPVLVKSDTEAETDTSDPGSFPKYRQSLRAHTDRVVEKLEALLTRGVLARCNSDPAWVGALRTAAAKHDWGKVHSVFQETMHRSDDTGELLAKQCGHARHRVKHFRHELASALAMLQAGDSDLAAYLTAAHHGRIRMGIRSMPGEREVEGLAVARGVREGDVLPTCELAAGVHVATAALSVAVMEFGADGGSWTQRMLRVRDELGPFRLAYLEMLLRCADESASADQGSEFTACPQ